MKIKWLAVVMIALCLCCNTVGAEPIYFRPIYLPLVIGEQIDAPPQTLSCPGAAPPETFAKVGTTAQIFGYGISGKACVVGLQTILIWNFDYDGGAGIVDIRLVKGGDYENPVAKYDVLDYAKGEWFHLCIPYCHEDADRIAIYSFTEGVRGVGIFTPSPTPTPNR